VAPLCFPQVALTREPRRSAVHDHQLRMQAPATDPLNTVSNRDWIPSCSLVVHFVVIVASANGQLGAVACSCIESSQTVADGILKAVGMLCSVIQWRGLGLFFLNVAVIFDMPVLGGFLGAMVTTLSQHDSSVHAPVGDLVTLRAAFAAKHMRAVPRLGPTLDALAPQAGRWSVNRAAFLGAVMCAGVRRMKQASTSLTRKRARAK
jgi:hypothetical protein